MKIKKDVITILFLVAVLLPASSHAFNETDRRVVQLSENLTLQAVSYEFKINNADVWMPINMANTTVNGLVGKIKTSLLLSTAHIDGTEYFISKGDKAIFTLLVLQEHNTEIPKVNVSLSSLLIKVQKEGKEKQLMVLKD